jgi:predicted nucleic acid-binding protein
VSFFADTSFLCALCRRQAQSASAHAMVASLGGTPFFISSAVETEFRASLEFQIFLHHESVRKKKKNADGCDEQEAQIALTLFDAGKAGGIIEIAPCDWEKVFEQTNRIAAKHARNLGLRTMDILHVAAACHMDFSNFATFDERQGNLARLCNRNVPLFPAP